MASATVNEPSRSPTVRKGSSYNVKDVSSEQKQAVPYGWASAFSLDEA
jgi:hypothetical protein